MHHAAVLRPGPGFKPTRAALYFAQRLVTAPKLRRVVQRAIGRGINLVHPLRLGGDATAGDSLDEAALAELRQDGLVGMPDLIAGPRAKAMADYFRRQKVFHAGKEIPLAELPAGVSLAPYPLSTVLACPGLLELINHPRVLRLAARYLGCTPTLSSLGVRWSLPRPNGAQDIQRFHRDYDDWQSVKLFIYLTDVDAEAAPHLYVHGSHRTAGTFRARLFDASEVAARFGAKSIRAITGPAGTSFVADVHGIHRGGVPSGRPRLMLQAQYSVLPVFAFQYEPAPPRPAPPVDPYVNRLLIRPN